jgi:hypothetical protein
MNILPRRAFAVRRGPQAEASKEPTTVWLGARLGPDRLGASIIECKGDYRTTAEAARAFGEKLLTSGRAGCFNPEDLFSLDEILQPLAARGMRISRS